jgi:Anaphase-promoting complex subunit 11 RING-H2 finger
MVLPQTFAVRKSFNGRDGYAIIKWTDGGADAQNRTIHVLKGEKHNDHFYNVIRNEFPTDSRTIATKKSSGRNVRLVLWVHTKQSLQYVNGTTRRTYHIINIGNVCIPAIKQWSFLPIVNNSVPLQVPLQAPLQSPLQTPVQQHMQDVVPEPRQLTFVISEIPQHAVRALLRDAVLNEEVCPITGEDIDVTNGAVTTCFHLFEKHAIRKWLSMPNSRDKCPTCNANCNSYTLTS